MLYCTSENESAGYPIRYSCMDSILMISYKRVVNMDMYDMYFAACLLAIGTVYN